MALQPAQTAVLIVGLAAAAWLDLRTRRIPNALSVAMALVGMILFAASDGLRGVWTSLQGVLVGFALFAVPFLMRALGGGDLKLAMAVGALTGPAFAWHALLYGVIAGGVIAASILVRQGRFVPFVRRLFGSIRSLLFFMPAVASSNAPASPASAPGEAGDGPSARQESFPYAVAVAVGVLLAAGLRAGGA